MTINSVDSYVFPIPQNQLMSQLSKDHSDIDFLTNIAMMSRTSRTNSSLHNDSKVEPTNSSTTISYHNSNNTSCCERVSDTIHNSVSTNKKNAYITSINSTSEEALEFKWSFDKANFVRNLLYNSIICERKTYRYIMKVMELCLIKLSQSDAIHNQFS